MWFIIYWNVLFGKMWTNMGKSDVFQGEYGRVGEIMYWRIWPDWGLKG